MSDVKKHTFNQGVDTILNECLAISDQRGSEYEDSWDLKNVSTPAVSHVLRLQGTFDMADETLHKRWRRLLLMASLIDVKLSRLLGAFKEDTFIDLINYAACFANLMREWFETLKSRPSTIRTTPDLSTFNDNVTADLRERIVSADHYHPGYEWRAVYATESLPPDGAALIRTHMTNSHRQDGSPIWEHRPHHDLEIQRRRQPEIAQAWLDHEYGPA